MAISVELKQARRDHILDTARKPIGRRDVSGFSMAELAEHAGVSPATPYNLVGSKPEILNALIRFEVKDFASSLEARQIPANLDGLFAAIDLVCERYSGQLNFYRGLFRLLQQEDMTTSRHRLEFGAAGVWRGFMKGAIEAGDLDPECETGPLVSALMRSLAINTLVWSVEGSPIAVFRAELQFSVRTLVAYAVTPHRREEVARQIRDLSRFLAGSR